MIKVIDWLKTNKLSLNLKKTHFMNFRKRRSQIALSDNLVIDDVVINRTYHTKFLGAMVDQHLTFKSRVIYIKGKNIARDWHFVRGKKIVSGIIIVDFVLFICVPLFYLLYHCMRHTYSTVLDLLIKCQKRAVRIVHGAGKYDHTYPIFQSLQILNLTKLYIYSVQIFLYKYRQQKVPGGILSSIYSGVFGAISMGSSST